MNSNLVKSALQLLEARKIALEQMQRTSMKAHGKIMCKDLFTWYNADPVWLSNTLQTIPFPILWVTNCELYQQVTRIHKGQLENIHSIYLIDQPADFEVLDPLISSETEDLSQILQGIEAQNLMKAAVLISLASNQTKEHEIIENYISLKRKL